MDDAWGARRLSAGPIAAALEGGDLRALAVAGTPLLARVALVPRGVGWTTAPAIEQRVVVDDGGDGFAVAVTTRHQDAQTDIRFDATIAARADGTLRWHARGHALRDQNLLRAGWSVLLDRRLAGAAYEAITPAGPVRARLPIDVLAQVLDEDGGDDHSSMPALTAMTIALAGAARAQLTLEGSVFELEDQRNWHDASYKLYSPPVADPPLRLTAGTTWEQAVTLRVTGVATRPKRHPRAGARARAVVDVGAPTRRRLPALGATVGRPAHPSLRHVAAAVGAAADTGDRPLELHAGPGDAAAVARAVRERDVVRILATDAHGLPPAPAELRALRAAAGGAVPVLARADAFVGLNARPPDPHEADGLAWGVHPQAHARDQRSIAETVATQPDVVATARQLARSRPLLVVAPLRLAPPGADDPRAAGAFASGWLLGMLAALGCAGVAAVTLDDVLDAALLDDLARLSDHELVACTAPPEVAALVTRDAQGSAQALLANLGRRPVDVVVADAVIPLAPGARAHTPLPTDAVARGPRA